MSTRCPPSQRGLSLIELLIAMVLGLLLIAGVMQVFLSSKQTYSTTSALSRTQESGRFASEFLSFDIRNTGYKGECVAPINNLTGLTDDRFTLDMGLKAWDNSQSGLPSWFTASDRLAGTDMILVKHAVNGAGATAANTNNTATTGYSFVLTQASNIETGTILVTADPIGCDMFQNQSAKNAQAISRPNPGPALSHNYTNDMDILAYQSAVYFIKAGASGVPSLWRIRYNEGTTGMQAEEMVEGVQNMQLQFAVGNASGAITGDYVDAQSITDWSAVVSVKLSLLVVSSDTNVIPQNQVIAFNGSNVTIANRRLAQVFTSTIGIRNRLP